MIRSSIGTAIAMRASKVGPHIYVTTSHASGMVRPVLIRDALKFASELETFCGYDEIVREYTDEAHQYSTAIRLKWMHGTIVVDMISPRAIITLYTDEDDILRIAKRIRALYESGTTKYTSSYILPLDGSRLPES